MDIIEVGLLIATEALVLICIVETVCGDVQIWRQFVEMCRLSNGDYLPMMRDGYSS